jgi:hypothetical protein
VYTSYIDENKGLGNSATCAMTYELKRSCDSLAYSLTVPKGQQFYHWRYSNSSGAHSFMSKLVCFDSLSAGLNRLSTNASFAYRLNMKLKRLRSYAKSGDYSPKFELGSNA